MVKQLLNRGIILFVLVLCLLSHILVLAGNESIIMSIKPGVPLIIYYDENRRLEIESSKLLIIHQPVSVCLRQFYKACIKTNDYGRLYVLSMSTSNSLILLASNINITIHGVSVTEEELASGEALLMLIKFEDNTILNASVGSVYLLSKGIKRDITNIAFLRTENDSLYLSLNYEKGRLPFIEFYNNDTIEVSLYVNKGILKLVVVLRENTGTNEYAKESYTRIVGINNISYTFTSIYAPVAKTLTKIPMTTSFVKVFLKPLFVFTTILLVLSLILWTRINNTLNK